MKQIVYVASPESQQIHVWQLEDNGELQPLQVVEVSGQVQPMVLHPKGTHLYVGVRPDFRVMTYRVHADGTLELTGRAPLSAGSSYLSTDLKGHYLFSASYSGDCLSVSPIDQKGDVGVMCQQINGLITPHSANIDPSNRVLAVPCLKEDQVRLFALSDKGELTACCPAAVFSAHGAGPRHMVFHPRAAYAYTVNELNGTVDVLAIAKKNESYTRVDTQDVLPAGFMGRRWAADIHLTSDGRFLYVSERSASLLTLFSVSDSGGQISAVAHYPTEEQPRGFNLSHCGRFLIAAGQKSDHIAVYRIDPTQGGLTLLSRYLVGRGPMWVSIGTLTR